MKFKNESTCSVCKMGLCKKTNYPNTLNDCVYNLIIFESKDKILFYNFFEKRIYKIAKGIGLSEIDFKSAIREIDIIPTKTPEWKKIQILKLAKELGFFGI